jgi:hypothetical protein
MGRKRRQTRPLPITAIIRFLGYVPFKHDSTRGGMMRWLRNCAGLSKAELSTLAACDEGTVRRSENNPQSDEGRRGRAMAALEHRLEILGISELTYNVVAELLDSRDVGTASQEGVRELEP